MYCMQMYRNGNTMVTCTNKAQDTIHETTHAQYSAASCCIILHFRMRKVWILSFSISKSSKLKKEFLHSNRWKFIRIVFEWFGKVCLALPMHSQTDWYPLCYCLCLCWLYKKNHTTFITESPPTLPLQLLSLLMLLTYSSLRLVAHHSCAKRYV